jgi:hypothetical protein
VLCSNESTKTQIPIHVYSHGFTEIDDYQKNIKNWRSAHHILPSTKVYFFSQQGDDGDDDDDDDLTSDNDGNDEEKEDSSSDNVAQWWWWASLFFHMSIAKHTDVVFPWFLVFFFLLKLSHQSTLPHLPTHL